MIEWKPVKDFDGIYEVSNDGQVRSLDRIDCAGRRLKGKVIRQSMAGKGYPHIPLNKDGKQFGRYVHRMVAEAFMGSQDGMEVNHINGDKTDNRVENLEWVSHADNIAHAESEGLARRDELGRFAA